MVTSIAGLAINQAASLLGKTMGGYSSYGFSLNQGIVNALYSAGVNQGLPALKAALFPQSVDMGLASQVGFSNDATELDIRHRISIFSLYQNTRIQCPIQKQMEINTGSTWVDLVPAGMREGISLINATTQSMGFSLYQKFFSRRIWAGSRPIQLKLPMIFVAVNDAYQDVSIPVQRLLKMALPRTGSTLLAGPQESDDAMQTEVKRWAAKSTQTLVPPGPDPIPELDGLTGTWGERIDIYFGKIACFRNVIVSDVNVVLDSRVDAAGKPIAAHVDVIFETYEMYTTEDIDTTFTSVNDTGAATATSSTVSAS